MDIGVWFQQHNYECSSCLYVNQYGDKLSYTCIPVNQNYSSGEENHNVYNEINCNCYQNTNSRVKFNRCYGMFLVF